MAHALDLSTELIEFGNVVVGQPYSHALTITNPLPSPVELVIRATKELEFLLETHFLPPLTMSQDKTIGLHDKISMARINGKPLPDHAIRKMRFLVTLRNKIVHDHECNSIPDRPRFVKDFDEVEKSLRELLPDDKGSGCAIS